MDIDIMRHSTAHVMAAAICRLFPNVKLDIGPATDTGFYYDFDMPDRLSPEDFPRIEKEMGWIIKQKLAFERIVFTREEANALLTRTNQPYKLERLADIPEGSEITFYKLPAGAQPKSAVYSDFYDLCRGPHVADTGEIKAYKLISVAGSYFRGDEKKQMLQRVYGIVAESQEELDQKIKQLEEAKERDHRKLGKELDLFSIEEDVGPGLVHWHPKAGRIRCAIEDFWRKRHYAAGYEIVFTPHVGRAQLWQTSGHLDFYKENMYAPMDIDGHDYFVKPMNCPFHIQIYKSQMRSYRDLPLRWAELGTVYRYEKSGVLHGLLRVRGFTQDDAHIFCTPGQIEDEVRRTVNFALGILRAFGFKEISAYLSTKPEKAVGEPARWDQAIISLENALKAEGISYQVEAGGGAFYGPKIDLKVKDCIGREWQLGTIQFDFNLPDRFNLTFIGEDGKEHKPYMVHRALLGSLERFFGILIEHYGGAFPFWLAPEQVRLLPITEKQMEYSDKVADSLRAAGIRVCVDRKSEKIGAKIRRAQTEKIPCMLIIGQKEMETGTVSLRHRLEGDKGAIALDALIPLMQKENVAG